MNTPKPSSAGLRPWLNRLLQRASGPAAAEAPDVAPRPWHHHAAALGGLALLTVAMFAPVLFTSEPIVLSNRETDLFHQFVPWREFGFGELRKGNLALWNPHLFCGAPFFGGFQSALLYPPNWLHLILPTARAINVGIALHVFLAGAFMYFWVAQRGLHPLAGFLSGVCFMFGGAYFPHIFAGHLPNLCTMAWAPLLFLALDRWWAQRSAGAVALGMLAVAMQVLAGHPQYVFYTAIAAAVYTGLRLLRAPARLRALAGVALMYAGGAALCAVQLLPGLAESRETLRSGGVSYEFAAMFSFPPENVLTLLAPEFFGNFKGAPAYWGRCYLWEMTLFMSVTALALAVYGAVSGERTARRFAAAMVGICLVLALGAHTPVFSVLYHYVPGFDRFRGNSKFIFLVALFLSLLAGVGLDRLLRASRPPAALVGALVGLGVVLGMGALALGELASAAEPQSFWPRLLDSMWRTGESYMARSVYGERSFQVEAGRHAADSLLRGAGTCLLAALLFHLAGRSRRFVAGVLALAVLELWWFARGTLDWFDLRAAEASSLQQFASRRSGGDRVLNLADPNRAMSVGALEIWGYDPGVLRRYAEFIAFTQGLDPGQVTQYVAFRHRHRLYAMLRCRYVWVPESNSAVRQLEFDDVLPRLLLVRHVRVLNGRDAIFAAMNEPTFDPGREVILETAPEPAPAPEGRGTVRLLDESTDHLTIEAELSAPAILLITDSYARGWRARPLDGGAQRVYRVLPANWCLRAVPLAAGTHRIVLEYVPRGWVAGCWISGIATAGLALFLATQGRLKRAGLPRAGDSRRL